jgi:arylsulfatase A-like enzyme
MIASPPAPFNDFTVIREIARRLSVLCLGALVATELQAQNPAAPSRPPNVILIVADDLALGDLSTFNGGRSHTPNLDKLIADGIFFPHAYSGSPVCAPARAALHTGRFPHRTGVVSLSMASEPARTRLLVDEVTVADLYRRDGYSTGLVGKWHLGLGEQWHPKQRGFDEFSGFITARSSYFSCELEVGDEFVSYPGRYLTDVLSELAIDFVRRHRDRPFFLELAHFAPHRPLEAPEEVVLRYLERGYEKDTAIVYAMVEVMDRGIGELMSTLDDLGLHKNTIIVFVSDNGRDAAVADRFNLGLRGTKYEVHEGGIRVPFVISWPGALAPRSESGVVHFIDVLPTLLDLCSIPAPPSLRMDGVNLGGLLRQQEALISRPLFWQWNRGEPNYTHNAAMREGDWKLMRPFVTRTDVSPADSHAASILFNLAVDPSESTDVSKQHPERFERMSRALEAWSTEVEADRTRPALESSQMELTPADLRHRGPAG